MATLVPDDAFFGPHDAKIMPKNTYQNQVSRENNDAKPKTTLVFNDGFFWIARYLNDDKKNYQIQTT